MLQDCYYKLAAIIPTTSEVLLLQNPTKIYFLCLLSPKIVWAVAVVNNYDPILQGAICLQRVATTHMLGQVILPSELNSN